MPMTSARAHYPRTAHAALVPQDLSARQTRERLSPAALRAFLSIMAHWEVRDEDARLLLGGVSHGTFYDIKRDTARVCSADELTRISSLVGIFKALNILHSEVLADRWIQLPNINRLFNGLTPLEFIVRGGIPALDALRRLLDARRGGM